MAMKVCMFIKVAIVPTYASFAVSCEGVGFLRTAEFRIFQKGTCHDPYNTAKRHREENDRNDYPLQALDR
jgi:hypothetical protein